MGCANIARRSVIPAMLKSGLFDVCAIASRSQEKADEFAAQFNCKAVEGYENLLNDESIEAIYMPLPTGLHEEWVDKCLSKGKHILCEKSLAMDYASAQRMVEKAKEKNLLLMENFMFLYHSQHEFVKEQIASGSLGEIRCFRSYFGFPPLREGNFRYDKAAGGGSLLDAAAYTVRSSQLFLGDDLTVEAAVLNSTGSQEVDIYGGAFLKSASGAFSEVAFGFDNFYQCEYEIWGSKGKLIAKKAFTPKPGEKPTLIIEKQDKRDVFQLPADDHFVNILTEFSTCIKGGDFESKYREILNQSRLLDEIRRKTESA